MHRSRSTLTALDWIAAGVAWLLTMVLILFAVVYTPSFRRMFADFGGELPWLTKLVLTPWPALAASVVATGAAVCGVTLERLAVGSRRALIVAGFFIALGGLGVCVAGVYLPIVEIAGAVAP